MGGPGSECYTLEAPAGIRTRILSFRSRLHGPSCCGGTHGVHQGTDAVASTGHTSAPGYTPEATCGGVDDSKEQGASELRSPVEVVELLPPQSECLK